MVVVGHPQLELREGCVYVFSAVFADMQPTFMNKHVAQTPSPLTELFILKRDLE